MKFLETKGLHIYSTPPALNVKYLNLTRGQLPTPRSATCNLGSKESGSDRTERKDVKMSFFTVFCLRYFHPLHRSLLSAQKPTKQIPLIHSKMLRTWVQRQGIHTCYYTPTKSIDLMVAWSTRMLEHLHGVWRHLSQTSTGRLS